jgi:DNA-binding HxlR family transcriptional regulator
MNNTKSNQKSNAFKKPSNFAEALLELGSRPSPSQNSKEQKGQTEKDWLKERLKNERHQEVINTQVFNREQEEIKSKITEIQEELKQLASEMSNLGTGIDKAIQTNITNPGTYHISFFEALKRYLVQLRKKASESKNWLAISQQRKQSQNHYWGSVKSSGTKFMLSQERTLATQAG